MIKKVDLPGVIYEFTTKCNLKCKYCYNHWKKDDLSNFINDVEKYNPKKTLKKWFKVVKTDEITFSGGEPTTNYEELLDCIMYVKARNKKVTVITNATLLDKQKIDILSKLKVDLCEITINSYNKEIHEQINGIEGSFKKSIDAIKYLLSKRMDVVVPIVITNYNIKDIDKTLEYIYNLGIRRIMVNRYNIGGNGCKEYKDILPKLDDLKMTYSKCNEFAKEKNIKLYSLVCTPICAIDPDRYSNIEFSNCGCENLNRRYTLTRNGDVRYCNHSPESIGNIYINTMKEILQSEKLLKWSQTEPEFCKNCDKKEKCQYGCRAASQQMGYDLTKEDPLVEIYKLGKTELKNEEINIKG